MSVINKIKIGTGAEVDIGVTWSNVSGKPSTFTPASHTHSYAGSSSAGGPANDFVVGAGSDDADRYVYFAYNNTTYNNSDSTKITKGRAVIDPEFKYNPSTNTLTAGTFKGSLSGNASSATTATKAMQDSSGNIIKDTYATKTELTTALGDVETLLSNI